MTPRGIGAFRNLYLLFDGICVLMSNRNVTTYLLPKYYNYKLHSETIIGVFQLNSE